MGFNRRKMEDRRQQASEKEAAARRATDAQVFEDAERLISAWNERQAKRMPMLFSPTIGAAIAARYWYLWVRCPACRTTQAIDLRTLDRHPDAAVTSLIPSLSCRSCRPHAPFAELVRLSRTSIADEMRIEHTRRIPQQPTFIRTAVSVAKGHEEISCMKHDRRHHRTSARRPFRNPIQFEIPISSLDLGGCGSSDVLPLPAPAERTRKPENRSEYG